MQTHEVFNQAPPLVPFDAARNPALLEGLHREGLVYVPLSDVGVSSPVIMNCRVADSSELLAQFRQLVMAIAESSPSRPCGLVRQRPYVITSSVRRVAPWR